MVLDGPSLQESTINAKILQGSIFGSTLFQLYINGLLDDIKSDVRHSGGGGGGGGGYLWLT